MKAWIIHAFIFAFNIYFAFDAELSAVGTPTLSITPDKWAVNTGASQLVWGDSSQPYQ
jgi:hypothetical protein